MNIWKVRHVNSMYYSLQKVSGSCAKCLIEWEIKLIGLLFFVFWGARVPIWWYSRCRLEFHKIFPNIFPIFTRWNSQNPMKQKLHIHVDIVWRVLCSNQQQHAAEFGGGRVGSGSPPCCMVDGSTFSPADSDTKKAKGITHRQMVKYARTLMSGTDIKSHN